MSKALFFNALPDDSSATGYDRNYNADDLSDFLSIVCDTGVVKTNNDASGNPQGLKVSSPSGRTVNVAAGKAVIRGKAFINEATASFEVEANGTASTRYDYVVVRYDNNVSARNITLELVKGTTTPPTSAVDAERVKELVLAVANVIILASRVKGRHICQKLRILRKRCAHSLAINKGAQNHRYFSPYGFCRGKGYIYIASAYRGCKGSESSL